MKKIFVFFLLVALAIPSLAMGEDSKEVLTLKRDLAAERVLRLSAELELIRSRFQKWQEALVDAKAELNVLNSRLLKIEDSKGAVDKEGF